MKLLELGQCVSVGLLVGFLSVVNTMGGSLGSASKSSSGHPQFYDQVYFDSSESSDEEEAVAASSEDVPRRRRGRTSRKVKKLTNDELFYDPNMDDEDEKWMNRRRMAYHNGME